MGNARESIDERRTETRKLVDRMLAERRELLVLYEKLAGIMPFGGRAGEEDTARAFTQLLVDYIAAGHFGLYQRISAGEERRRSVVKLAEELYPRIAATTESAMAFNDAYEKGGPDGADAARLSSLGEELALRIELEDRLIERLLEPRN